MRQDYFVKNIKKSETRNDVYRLEMQIITNNVVKMIEEKLFHPLLNEKMAKPILDIEKLQFFIKIFTKAGISNEKIEELTTAIMIMQIALDTHDMVTNAGNDESTLFNRQLIILAGDYYSGLYYQMLANFENKPLLDKLSEAIKEINEWKIIAQYEITSIETLKLAKLKIDTLLLMKTCEALGEVELIQEIELNFSSR
ncbi:MAG: hepS [Bacillales bacterium]|jgi:heptaprenyl diphosphate synthase|nr:hepS [Bacillales bacterium]